MRANPPGDYSSGAESEMEIGGEAKYRRLVDFDQAAWNMLIKMRREMEEREKKCRVSISEVINSVLRGPKQELGDYDILAQVRSELLNLWKKPDAEKSDFQRGFESGLIFVLQHMEAGRK
ncbi:MAG: hypothetical protein KIS29_04025 [Thermoplasmata archaeon]|jgi:hypothetical protein|nr:hypothetical protein [Candidatus Sysuiplasma jiujiangense]